MSSNSSEIRPTDLVRDDVIGSVSHSENEANGCHDDLTFGASTHVTMLNRHLQVRLRHVEIQMRQRWRSELLGSSSHSDKCEWYWERHQHYREGVWESVPVLRRHEHGGFHRRATHRSASSEKASSHGNQPDEWWRHGNRGALTIVLVYDANMAGEWGHGFCRNSAKVQRILKENWMFLARVFMFVCLSFCPFPL